MDLYSKPITDIAYADILAFLDAKHPESQILDYKSAWIEHPARVMAAFANTDGGIMLIGVTEEDKTGIPLSPPPGINLGEGEDAIKRQVESAAYDAVYPPFFPEVQVCPKDDDPSKAVILVRVAQSHQTPHCTDDRQRAYVRVQSQNRFTERQAYLEEWHWLLDRRKAAIELRESMLARTRDRATLIRASATQPAPRQAMLEAYAVPLYPDRSYIGLAELLQFANRVMVHSEVRQGAYTEFPISIRARPVAEGVLITDSDPTERKHCVQINQWGMVHSQLYLDDCARTPEQPPQFYVSWLVAPVDAFLRYLLVLCRTFSAVQAKPMLLSARVTLPPVSYLIWLDGYLGEVRPSLETEIRLLNEVRLPGEIESCADAFTREMVQRVLWAGGYVFAGQEGEMDNVMKYLCGRR